MNSIDECFEKNKEIIFRYVIKHLADDDVRYEDKNLFEKFENYISSIFISNGFEWSVENKKRVHYLFLNSDSYKSLAQFFQKNYEYWLVSQVKWTPDPSVQRMIRQIIDFSVKNNRMLLYSYARYLLVKCYYSLYKTGSNMEKLVGNVVTIYCAYTEMQYLLHEANDNIDKLIALAYKRINETIGEKIDPKLFIRKFVMLKSFHLCIYRNEILIEQLRNSQYISIYFDLMDGIEKILKELSKNEAITKTEQQTSSENKEHNKELNKSVLVTEEKVTEQKLAEATVTKKDSVQSSAGNISQSVSENNENSKVPEKEETPIDIFLKKIGRKKVFESDPIAVLLKTSEDIIKNYDEHIGKYEEWDVIYFCEELVDVEIEALNY